MTKTLHTSTTEIHNAVVKGVARERFGDGPPILTAQRKETAEELKPHRGGGHAF